ncbi:hypothetical protein GGE48_000013 [Rhizobium leguminosarum]|nr:hypothetical protein [Rhizobium leguminosarum]
MAECAGDEQICLAFQGGSLNDAGWRVFLRLHGCDIDGKTSLSERGHKAVSRAFVNLLIIGDGNQDDTRDLFQQQSGACQCPRDSGSSIPGDANSLDPAAEIIRGKSRSGLPLSNSTLSISGLISSDAFKMERSYARESSARVCATNGSLAGSILTSGILVVKPAFW